MLFISGVQLYTILCSWSILYITNNYSNKKRQGVLGGTYSAFSGKKIVVRMESPLRKYLTKWWKMLHSGRKFQAGGQGSRWPYWGEMGSFILSPCMFVNSTCLCNDKQPSINNCTEGITSHQKIEAIAKFYEISNCCQ